MARLTTPINERICYNCGSNNTYIKKSNGRPHWINIEGNAWCLKCYNKVFIHPKWSCIHYLLNGKHWNSIRNPKHMKFKDRIIVLKQNPRTGFCSWCPNNIHDRSCKRTHIHHIEYHNDDPLKKTVEICASCHAKESWRIKRNLTR